MRKIAVINQKGGVGKTTTAVNLGAAVAAIGRRALIIDIDPQAHATLHLGATADGDAGSLYDVFTGARALADVRQQVGENLWIVPGHINLAAVEVEAAGLDGRELLLRDHLAAEPSDAFDYVFVDCPPSLGVLTINALAAVDEVLIPLQPHFLALHGLSKLLETMQLVAERLNPGLKLGGVAYCMYETGTRLAAEVTGDIEGFFSRAGDTHTPWSTTRPFATRIRRNIRLAEAPSFGQSIFQYAADSNGAADYRQLAEELVARYEPSAVGLPADWAA